MVHDANRTMADFLGPPVPPIRLTKPQEIESSVRLDKVNRKLRICLLSFGHSSWLMLPTEKRQVDRCMYCALSC